MPTDIRAKLADPGFTPGRRDVGPLFELLATADEDEATKAVRGLSGVPSAVERALTEWAGAAPPLRHRLVMLIARAQGDDAQAPLLDALANADPRTRKAAARGLGRLESAEARTAAASAMRDVMAREDRPEVTRAIIEALGKIGSATDKAAFASKTTDEQTERVRREAERRIDRTEGRQTPSRIMAERVLDAPFEVELRCREGLESILAGEIRGARIASSGRVITRTRSLRELSIARTWSTAALVVYRGVDTGDAGVARLIAGAAPLLKSLTDGVVRWRVEWLGAGHRRAATRSLAESVVEGSFVNDPIASDWEIEIARERNKLRVMAIPKSWDDGRFSYRVADVPAASHPTIAAAIARVGGAREDDVVWDPFVGSGLELVERARLGAYRSLLGTDTDARALTAARKNMEAARVRDMRLELGDARTFRRRGVTLVLTNPPMGKRVKAAPKLDAVLEAALVNVTRALAPGGRLVWISPSPRTTNRVLERAGMQRSSDLVVDMRGFAANLQLWTRLDTRE